MMNKAAEQRNSECSVENSDPPARNLRKSGRTLSAESNMAELSKNGVTTVKKARKRHELNEKKTTPSVKKWFKSQATAEWESEEATGNSSDEEPAIVTSYRNELGVKKLQHDSQSFYEGSVAPQETWNC